MDRTVSCDLIKHVDRQHGNTRRKKFVQILKCFRYLVRDFNFIFLICFMFLLWPTLVLVFYDLPYYLSADLRATYARVYCDASVYCIVSVYTVLLCMRGTSTFAF